MRDLSLSLWLPFRDPVSWRGANARCPAEVQEVQEAGVFGRLAPRPPQPAWVGSGCGGYPVGAPGGPARTPLCARRRRPAQLRLREGGAQVLVRSGVFPLPPSAVLSCRLEKPTFVLRKM